MLLQGWSIALVVTWLLVFALSLIALVTAIRVIRFWHPQSDTSLQIRLEEETWLTSALMQFGFLFQLISLLMLVLAADSFSGQLIGAMCATGALTANGYGIPALLLKIVLVFVSGYWLLIHRLDLQGETMPLTYPKYILLPFLLPLLVLDGVLLLAYLVDLSPDVITSCCGVLIRPGSSDGYNLLDPWSPELLLSLFYGLAAAIASLSWLLAKDAHPRPRWLIFFTAGLWALFFPVALWAITIYFSSYIYAMPAHRCPFDILQSQFWGIGYPIYAALFGAVFLGTASGVAELVVTVEGLQGLVNRFQKAALRWAIVLLVLLLLLTGYAPIKYLILGGEG